MNTFDVPERHEVAEANQQIFDNLKSKLGFVPNLYASMAHSDTGLANYLQFQGAKTSFSNKEKEVINLVVSEFNQCKYCQAAHTAIGKMNGFSDEQILDIRSAQINWDSKIAALARLRCAAATAQASPLDTTSHRPSEARMTAAVSGYSKRKPGRPAFTRDDGALQRQSLSVRGRRVGPGGR